MDGLIITSEGRFETKSDEALKLVLDRAKTKQGRLALHLHGGLVPRKGGEEIAVRVANKLFAATPDYEPFFFIWRTGVKDAITGNLDELHEISSDDLFKKVMRSALKWAGDRVLDLEAGARGTGLTDANIEHAIAQGTEPFSDREIRSGEDIAAEVGADEQRLVNEAFSRLKADPLLARAAQRLDAELNAGAAYGARGIGDPDRRSIDLLDSTVREELERANAGGDGSRSATGVLLFIANKTAIVAARMVVRFVRGRDHGLWPTAVEETLAALYADRIGQFIWGAIKDDAKDHFKAGGAGEVLIQELAQQKEGRLLLTAHSAGSVLACHLIEAARSVPNYFQIDAAFLAPAVRMDLAAKTLPLLNARKGRFRLFTMRDELERADRLDGHAAGKVYPRSLLYFVSGVCERGKGRVGGDTALLGLERHLTNLDDKRLTKDERQDRATLKTFLNGNTVLSKTTETKPGFESQADSHTAFDREATTFASLISFANCDNA